jgi:UDP-hydrolysing UDP-N-acetyl-D-glucosamine 2-epimerase
MIRRIVYITGTRADYGLMKLTLDKINHNDFLSLQLIVTGMHLMDEFGNSLHEIENDGFSHRIVNTIIENDFKGSSIQYIGKFLISISQIIPSIKPNIILLLGDRAEMLAGAIVGAYFGIPVAHVHGGERSSTVDDTIRHAITKLSNIHFTATSESAKRIKKMGENPSYIFNVGAPGLDQILSSQLLSPHEIADIYKINLSQPLLVVIQHPVTSEIDTAAIQMRETMEAVLESNEQAIAIYPNADPGGRKMIEIINEYKNYSRIKIYKNISHKEFLSLMQICSVLIGNSSSGIIESPSFKVPSINVGTRQNNRERAISVIDVGYNKTEILRAIHLALYNESFKDSIKNIVNPYGDGHASDRIVNVLSSIPLTQDLLQKRMMY